MPLDPAGLLGRLGEVRGGAGDNERVPGEVGISSLGPELDIAVQTRNPFE